MAAGRFQRRPPATTAGSPEDRIARLVEGHASTLLRVARQHSLCVDDAHDAYQRALEIYLRRLETIDPATEGAWMKVVVRHEAMAVRRSRSGSVNGEEVDLDARPDDDVVELEDRLARAERSARSAEVLRRLKPDEATALLLKAEGHSYDEIGRRQGWTYTKVNRAITEGRRRFIKTYADLESGDECESYRPALMDLARGNASAESLLQLRPHLRHCPACRATVRELRGGRRRVAGWIPLPAFLFGSKHALDYESNISELGGATAAAPPAPGRLTELKLHLQALVHRLSGSDVATSAQLAGSSGGGRGLTVATVLGICVSSVSAGTYCVATLIPDERPAPVERKAEKKPRAAARASKPQPPVKPEARLAAAPTATPTPKRRAAREPRKRPAGSAATAARLPIEQQHESSPPPAPATQGQQELSFEQTVAPRSSSQAQPAAAPASGGEEFSP